MLVVASSRLRKYRWQKCMCVCFARVFFIILIHFSQSRKKKKREEKSWTANKRKYQFIRRIAQVFLSHSVWIKMNVQRGERTNDKQLSVRSLAFFFRSSMRCQSAFVCEHSFAAMNFFSDWIPAELPLTTHR